jgi:hypothetical protein
MNGCMAMARESVDTSKDVGVGLISGLDDTFIRKVGNSAVGVAVVVVVVVTDICVDKLGAVR